MITTLERDSIGTIKEGWSIQSPDVTSDLRDGFILSSMSYGYKRLDAKEEANLSKRLKDGDSYARQILICSNIPLVYHIASKHFRGNAFYADLVQAGMIGLVKAVDRFEYAKGYRFSTYADLWIINEMRQELYKYRNVIKIPARMIQKINDVYFAMYEYHRRHGEYPSIAELAAAIGTAEKQITKVMDAIYNTVSIDAIIDDHNSLSDILPDTVHDEPATTVENTAMEKDVETALRACLTEREIDIIKFRYGFRGKRYTLSELSKRYGVSQERIRQIERRSLKKLRSYAESHELEQYLECA